MLKAIYKLRFQEINNKYFWMNSNFDYQYGDMQSQFSEITCKNKI